MVLGIPRCSDCSADRLLRFHNRFRSISQRRPGFPPCRTGGSRIGGSLGRGFHVQQQQSTGQLVQLVCAVFAATSLGYLTPAELFCRQIKDNHGNPSRWKGQDWLTYRLCEFRLMPATSSTNTDAPAIAMRDLVSRLDQIDQKVGTHEWFRERLAELMGDHERRLRQIEESDRKPKLPLTWQIRLRQSHYPARLLHHLRGHEACERIVL